VPLGLDVIESVHRQVDASGLVGLAGQRGFFPGAAAGSGRRHDDEGPLVVVAGGRGFTPWSRDSIDLLRAAGARIMRLDLVGDEGLPSETAGVVLAGHLWVDALPELAENYQLMRELRVRAGEGMPMLALGGGMLYFLRRVQDDRGRSFDLAGVLPAEGEIIGDLEEATYLDVEVKRECLLFSEGDRVKGWVSTDAEIMEAPASRSLPFSVSAPGWESPQLEGAVAKNLLCSRVLVHLASVPQSAGRFVAACGRYAGA
jgi:cobyrinic acid a,c-diamide synthase